LSESEEEDVASVILAYFNRLSDLLWLFGRKLEAATEKPLLRNPNGKDGPRWSGAR
jgi:cob(I)alamin adenosyltransferase